MKRIFTLLGLAAAVFSVSAETVYLANPDRLKQNVLSGTELGKDVPEGFSLQCMNPDKKLESGNEFTIDGTKYRTIKISNGAQNTLTLPEGYVATKLTLYTTINKDAATDRACYWKEVAGTDYTAENNKGIIESFKNFETPNIQSFEIPDLNVVTFTNTGEQPLVVIAVDYEKAGASEGPKVLWKSEDAAGVLAGWGNPVFTVDAAEAAQFKAGDNFIFTVASVDKALSDYPQVAINAGTTGGWPPALNAIVGGATEVTFGLTYELTESIHENGISFYGDAAYISQIAYQAATIEVGPNTVFVGPKACGWGDPATISKEVLENVTTGAKIVVYYDKSAAENTFNFLFGGWGGCGIPTYELSGVDFISQDSEAGTYTVDLNSASLAQFTWKDQEYDLYQLMKDGGLFLQGPTTILKVDYFPAAAEPVYPKTLDFTLNGEKELSGVNVSQELNSWDGYDNLQITIEGEYDAEEIKMEFATPEGWEFAVVNTTIGGGMTPFSTRSEDDWYSMSDMPEGFDISNSLVFPVNGRNHMGTIFLGKGDKVWASPIDIAFNVSNPAAGGDDPVVPETLNATASEKGVIIEVSKNEFDGTLYVEINGTSTTNEYSVVIDVPEGWDGFVCQPWFSEVGIEEAKASRKKAASMEHNWLPIDNFLSDGFTKGNKLTFYANNDWSFVDAYLYKGDQVDMNAGVSITAHVEKVDPFVVTTSSKSLEVSQEDFDGSTIVTVTGTCTDKEYTVTVETPDGYDGFLGYSDLDMNPDLDPLKKLNAPEWESVEDMLADGLKKTNSLTFPVDGEEHWGQLIPYVGDKADVANAVNIETYVTSLQIPTEFEVSTSNATLTVDQAYNSEEERYKIAVTGELSAKSYTVAIDVPEGWTGFMALAHDDESVTMLKKVAANTGNDWMPVSEFENAGYKSASVFTFKNNDEKQYVDLYLYAGDKVDYNAYIQLMTDVKKVESNDPVLPRELNVFTDAEGVEITQFIDWGSLTVNIEGEVAQPTVDVVVDVPEGWDGFITNLWTDNVTVSESNINPRKAKIPGDEGWEPEEIIWRPIEQFIEAGYKKGNVYTIQADGKYIDFVAYLYKGDQVDYANGYYFQGGLTYNGQGSDTPEFPYNFDVMPDNWDVEIWQGGVEDIAISGVTLDETEAEFASMFMAENAVVATGKTDKATVALTFDLPEGWAGVLPFLFTVPTFGDDDYLYTRANPSEFASLEDYVMSMSAMGWFSATVEPGKTLVFPANGEKQVYLCNLYVSDTDGALSGGYPGNYVDVANSFLIVVDVESTGNNAVNGINAADGNATYYDVNGHKIANPDKGVYVKIVDGKASKVVVK